METRFAMWVHGVSVVPERTAKVEGSPGPLAPVSDGVNGPWIPWSEITGLRQGFGATFHGKAGYDNWFHFSIPTPVIMPIFQPADQHYNLGQGIRLEKVFVLFKNYVSPRGGALAHIQKVDVWDGGQTRYDTRLVPAPAGSNGVPSPIGLNLPPDPEPLPPDSRWGEHHLDIQAGWNAWTITDGMQDIKPLIRWGICISSLVHFSTDIDIRFVAAGADFVLEVP